ncbi:MAG: TIGR04086 family membrane protein [Christensenellaceae bacterium]|nr:TIGR04086 family membrane protein [Christensenellaceae bacterium]
MAKHGNTTNNGTKTAVNPIISILKSALIALLCSMVLIVISALLLQKQILEIDSIRIINPVIKAASSLIAALIGVRCFENKSWLYGAISGIVYVVFSFAVFSILTNDFSFNTGTFIDLLMCGCAGMVGGILHRLSK